MAREWWITTIGSGSILEEPPWPEWPKDDEVAYAWAHVIEKSAYDELLGALKMLLTSQEAEDTEGDYNWDEPREIFKRHLAFLKSGDE